MTLGYKAPGALVEEAQAYVERGFRALKLRIGDCVKRDAERIFAVRGALGPDITLMSDANTAYPLSDVRAMAAVLEEAGIEWLEEPFSPSLEHAYAAAAGLVSTPIAAGEYHHTRFEFQRLMDEGAVSVMQPDLSKSGGMTECLRIAAKTHFILHTNRRF